MKKNVVYYVTSQYMKMNKKRTFTALLGIIFMVLLMTCVFVGKDTAIGYLEQIGTIKDGKWHITMYDITDKEYDEVKKLEWVEETSVSTYYGFAEFKQSANELRPYLNVKAYEIECFDWMNIELKSGRLPQKNGEIVVSEAAVLDGSNFSVGDEIEAEYFTRSIKGIDSNGGETIFPFYGITVEYDQIVEVPQKFPYYKENSSFQEIKNHTGKKQKLKVVGIIETPGYEEASAAGYTAITLMDEEEMNLVETFNLSAKFDLENISENYSDILWEIAGTHEMEFNDYVLIFSGNSANPTMNLVVFFMTMFFVILIMFASVFLIYNIFNMSFEERSRYLGMLSSVGATGRQKRSSVYFEACYLLNLALPIGFVSGLLIVNLGMKVLQPLLMDFMGIGEYVEEANVALQISVEAVFMICLLSIVTVLVSAYLPARKIGIIGPIECIRGNEDRNKKQYRMNLTMIKNIGVEGMLAKNSLMRQSKKTTAITGAVVTFLVVMVVTAFGSAAIEKVVESKMGSVDINANTDNWDYVFYSLGSNEEEYEALKKEIETDEEIEEVVEWYSGMFVGDVPSDNYSSEYWESIFEICKLYGVSAQQFEEQYKAQYKEVCVLALDEMALKEMAKKTGTDYEKLINKKIPSAIVVQSGEISTSNWRIGGRELEKYRFFELSKMTDKEIGENLDVSLVSEELEEMVDFPIQIAGYATSEQLEECVTIRSQHLWVIVSTDTAKQMKEILGAENGSPSISPELYIRTRSENPEIIEKLRVLSEDSESLYGIMEADYTKTFQEAILGIIHILLSCFVTLVSVICLLNVFNSIRNRVSGRSKEFAIMESVGMTSSQIQKMLRYESVGIVIRSIMFAAVIAFLMINLIQYGLIKIFGFMSFELPWILILIAVGSAVLIVVYITGYCYKRENRENILESIRNESV